MKEKLEKEAQDKEENKKDEGESEEEKKPTQKVDWDGYIVDDKWFERSVVILDYNITYGQLTAGYLAFVIIVVIITIIVSICLYRNREVVKVGIVRLSTAVRNSIAGRRVHQLPEDPEEQKKKMSDAVN